MVDSLYRYDVVCFFLKPNSRYLCMMYDIIRSDERCDRAYWGRTMRGAQNGCSELPVVYRYDVVCFFLKPLFIDMTLCVSFYRYDVVFPYWIPPGRPRYWDPRAPAGWEAGPNHDGHYGTGLYLAVPNKKPTFKAGLLFFLQYLSIQDSSLQSQSQ